MLTVQPVFFLSLLSILTNQQPQTNKLRQLLDVCSKNTLSSKKKRSRKILLYNMYVMKIKDPDEQTKEIC
jgi:hypothetical protein